MDNEIMETQMEEEQDFEAIQVLRGSRNFLTGFLRRNGLSLRALRTTRRPTIDQVEVGEFLQTINWIMELQEKYTLLNGDESNWLVIQPPKRVIAQRGADSVNCLILGDPKSGFTFMGTVHRSGEKLPIFAIARGKTALCHKQFGEKLRQNCEIDHSPSGWMSRDVFTRYLAWLRKRLPKRKHGMIYLVIDQYPCHVYDGVDAIASKQNICLIPVPKGGTPLYQPLDRLVYGELKSLGRVEWEEKFFGVERPALTKETALDLLLLSWDKITKAHIVASWDFNHS
jgi:hypothetical protein